MSFFLRTKSVNKPETLPISNANSSNPTLTTTAGLPSITSKDDSNDDDAVTGVIHLGMQVVTEPLNEDRAPGHSSGHSSQLTSTVKLLEEMPNPILSNIINMLAPHLSIVRNLNRIFRSTVDEYVEKKAQRFRNATEEAEVSYAKTTYNNIIEAHSTSSLFISCLIL